MRVSIPKSAISLGTAAAVTLVALSSGARAAGAEAPPIYAADFVSTAAFGVAMNDTGIVVGTSYPDPGCGPFCLPPQETVAWRDGLRAVLPNLPGFTGITVRSVNATGWVVGFAGFPGTTTRAVLWKPNGTTYDIVDLGVVPGTTSSEAVGIDDNGRVVGWSSTLTFPSNGRPFVWTDSSGMVDLATRGFPAERPLAISPGGTVATPGYWYRLEDPSSIAAMAPAPRGFYGPGSGPTAINDAGDQARFLISTGANGLAYLFRFHHEGSWQQLSSAGTGHLARYGVGSISATGTVTATVSSTGVVAYGADGLAQPLAPLVSPAYAGGEITTSGPMNATGQILAQLMVGRSPRLVRLVPVSPCTVSCIRVSSVTMSGKFVQDPTNPGSCTMNGNAYNQVSVKLKVTTETGANLRGVQVTGRFLDDYWTNAQVSGTTNRRGRVSFAYKGPCGVGAVAFLVDGATKETRIFDRTVGVVASSVIPQ